MLGKALLRQPAPFKLTAFVILGFASFYSFYYLFFKRQMIAKHRKKIPGALTGTRQVLLG
ncbi:MAG: hypothetical protein IIW48_07170 [Clostridia bacterium]|nr:hypothetical protein [Clostridia bacterium]